MYGLLFQYCFFLPNFLLGLVDLYNVLWGQSTGLSLLFLMLACLLLLVVFTAYFITESERRMETSSHLNGNKINSSKLVWSSVYTLLSQRGPVPSFDIVHAV